MTLLVPQVDLMIPAILGQRQLTIKDNAIYVNDRLCDPDAAFVASWYSSRVNNHIATFSSAYVVDVTSRCNMKCTYCYYTIDNKSQDRSIESVVAEVVASGFQAICLMGAEPTTRKDLPELITAVRAVVPEVAITTNGKRLRSRAYLDKLVSAGLTGLNYSMHFATSPALAKFKVQALKNLLDARVSIIQFNFKVTTLEDINITLNLIDRLIKLGVSPGQFCIRAGAALGAETKDSGLFISDMVKFILAHGAIFMPDGGSNLYYCELIYKGFNLHVARWPTNETITGLSFTGPVFGTPAGPMLAPVMATRFATSLRGPIIPIKLMHKASHALLG